MPSSSRSGHTFKGWSTSNTATSPQYAGGATYTIGASNVTFYAVWNVNSYTITFNGNGGNTPANITKEYGTTITLPSSSRTGYTFLGWSTNSTATNARYGGGTSYKIQGNARVINYAGIIRGATQREIKLEISGNANNSLIRYLDDIFDGLIQAYVFVFLTSMYIKEAIE